MFPRMLSAFTDALSSDVHTTWKNPLGSSVQRGKHECVTALLSRRVWAPLGKRYQKQNAIGWSGWAELIEGAILGWSQKVWAGHGSPKYLNQDYDRTITTLVMKAVEAERADILHPKLLSCALESACVVAVEALLAYRPGLSLLTLYPNGKTPLHHAVDSRHLHIMASKTLTGHQQGVYNGPPDPSLPVFDSFDYVGLGGLRRSWLSGNSTYDRDIFDEEFFSWHLRIVKLLVDDGSKPARDISNRTLLHVAALSGDSVAIKYLVDTFGADALEIDLKDIDGSTALDLARSMSHVNSQRQLILAGAKLSELGCGENTCADVVDAYPDVSRRTARSEMGQTIDSAWGEWDQSVVEELDINFCDFEILENIDEDTFFKKYFLTRTPVVIRDPKIMSWPAFKEWNRAKWKSTIPNTVFRVYEKPLGGKPRSFNMTLGDYLDYMERVGGIEKIPFWMHDTAWPASVREMFKSQVDDISLVTKTCKRSQPPPNISNFQFMVAPRYSGSPPHFHFTAANVLIHGRKRWFLFPPGRSFYSTRQPYDWIQTDYPELVQANKAPFECIQVPGDLLYVPEGWTHSTISVKDTIGYALLYTSGQESQKQPL
eukprot:c19467_g1_i3.p1 GENE.c19467_g1_i3~~c19467_g1_i3.p1  ORF type:complete len:600 (+),score=70.84 c19467_g1_i3:333-2132(+)